MGVRYNPDWVSSGRTAYGVVPEQTALPDRKAQLSALGVPVDQINSALTSNALADLRGDVSYEPSMNYSANMGIATGLQGSEFARRAGAADYLSRVEAAKQRGATNATNALGAISATQTVSPETQISLDQQNKQLAAAPDPQMAANAAIGAYQSALNRASSYYSTPSKSSSGGYAPMSQSGSASLSYPVPTAYRGTGTPEPSNDPTWGNWGSGPSWNSLAFGTGGGSTPAIPSTTSASTSRPSASPLVVNGYEQYDPSFYRSMADYYNPGIYSSGTDWSDFE